MEANPTSIEASRFRDFKRAGINRVSIGIQSFDDKQLKFLGREHSSNEAKDALNIAANNFDNFSFDLIYTLPNQTLEQWEKELKLALSVGTKHLSLYQLTIEKGTKFFSLHRDKVFEMPSAELSADFYELTQSIMEKANMVAYEVSNHAQNGFECKHNLAYWNYDDYLGIGPGAHGRYTNENKKFATIKIHSPLDWLKKVESENVGLQKIEELSNSEIRIEKILMGMRTSQGIDAGLVSKNIDNLINENLITVTNNKIIPTKKGILVLNTLTEALV